MNAPWNPPASLPPNRRVVLLFNFPVAKDDGGYHVPVAHVGTRHPARPVFQLVGPVAALPTPGREYPLAWLAAWAEVPA